MTRPGKRWLIPAALAALAVAITLSLWWIETPPLPDGFATANGRLEATRVDISTKQAGRLSEVMVREGDDVTREQVVARVDVRDVEADLRHAQAEFREAVQAKLATEAKLVQQDSTLEFAAAEFKRSQSLIKKKLIPQEEADLFRTKLRSEEAGLNAARASVTQADAAIEAAQAKIDSIQTKLDDSILRSPIVGRVLYRLAEPGEVLSVAGKILTLIDLTDVYMTVFLPTKAAGRVTVGSDARIVLDARPDVALPAKVSFVSPDAQFTPKEVETASEREKLMFRIKARIDPELLRSHLGIVPIGVPGIVYVRLDPNAAWPDDLRPPPATQKETTAWTTLSSQAD